MRACCHSREVPAAPSGKEKSTTTLPTSSRFSISPNASADRENGLPTSTRDQLRRHLEVVVVCVWGGEGAVPQVLTGCGR